jgi:hypothetical protein
LLNGLFVSDVQTTERIGKYLQDAIVFNHISQQGRRISLQQIAAATQCFDTARDVRRVDSIAPQQLDHAFVLQQAHQQVTELPARIVYLLVHHPLVAAADRRHAKRRPSASVRE